MNQTNFDFLSNDLKFLGFGEGLKGELKEAIETEYNSFEIIYRGEFDDDKVMAQLNFRRTAPEKFFFFSDYEMHLDEKSHTFFIFKGKGVTAKEAYNLLEGRAVHKNRVAKNGQTYNEWIELDLLVKEEGGFKVNIYPESYGFELSAAIDELQISTPTANWDRSMLIHSLEKGNLQTAFAKENGLNRRVFIQAKCQKERTISIHDLEKTKTDESEHLISDDDLDGTAKTKALRAKKLKDISI